MTAVDKQLDRAMLEVNCLSNIAKANGDLPTMYAANRAWHELEKARPHFSRACEYERLA